MRHRFQGFLGASGVVVAVLSLTSASTSPLRTPDGQPDLQGVWSFAVGIPLERPGKFGEKLVIDEETGEVAELQKAAVERNVGKDSREGAGTDADVGRAYNAFWWDYGTAIA